MSPATVVREINTLHNKLHIIAHAIQSLTCMTNISVEDERHKKWLAEKLNGIYEDMKVIIND